MCVRGMYKGLKQDIGSHEHALYDQARFPRGYSTHRGSAVRKPLEDVKLLPAVHSQVARVVEWHVGCDPLEHRCIDALCELLAADRVECTLLGLCVFLGLLRRLFLSLLLRLYERVESSIDNMRELILQ